MDWRLYTLGELKLIVELPKVLEELFVMAAELNSPFPLAARLAAEEFLKFIKMKGMRLEQMASEGPTGKNLGAIDEFALRSKASNPDKNGIKVGLGCVGMAIDTEQRGNAEMVRTALERMKPAAISSKPNPFLPLLAMSGKSRPEKEMAGARNAPAARTAKPALPH